MNKVARTGHLINISEIPNYFFPVVWIFPVIHIVIASDCKKRGNLMK
ncbi:hypothetical protein RAMDARK_0786 [Rickettsia amblyommatis str. Darkwater]|nr:hypothetical protein RAMDARK_0786 [Rickettsia amblyommatis str. Darkwater]